MTLKIRKKKQTERESSVKDEGSGDKGTTSEETSESESNQGLCNQGSGKKDDTLTMETTSDSEGGFKEEVNVPKK